MPERDASGRFVSRATFELDTDATKLNKGLADAAGQIKGVGATAEKALKQQTGGALKDLDAKLQKMTAKGGVTGAILGGVGVGAGIGIFSLITSAVGKVVDVMGDSIKAAVEEEQSISKLTTALEANVKGFDGNTAAIEEVLAARMRLGFADDEQRDSLAKLVTVTQDATKALDVQRIAMDLARLRGMSLADASALLGKVYGGNIGVLSRYGIQLKKGTTATEALAEVQKRASGQAEAFANTVQGKMTRAQIEIGEAMEKVGGVLVPLVAEFAGFAADTIPGIIAGLGNMGDAFNNLHRFMNPNVAVLQDFEEAVRAHAIAMGLDADAAVEWTRVQTRAEEAQQQAIYTGRERQALIDEQRQSLQGLQFTEEEIEARVKEFTRLLDEQNATVSKATETVDAKTEADQRAIEALRGYTTQVLNLGGAIVTLDVPLKKSSAALGGVGDAAGGAEGDLASLGRGFKQLATDWAASLEPLAGITRHSLDEATKEAKVGAAQFAWAMKHPLEEAKLADFYERQVRLAGQRARAAQKHHNAAAYAIEVAALRHWKDLLSGMQQASMNIHATWSGMVMPVGNPPAPPPRGGRRGGTLVPGGVEANASGGPIVPGQAYLYGERGPEIGVFSSPGYMLNTQALQRLNAGMSGSGGGGSSRQDVYHHLSLDTVRNLRTVGYDERGVAGFMVDAVRDAGMRYSSPRR